MKRALSLVVLLALLSLPGAASAATNEIRVCGKSHGREVTAGNYSQGNIPRTGCSFAWATNRRVRARERGAGLSPHFTMHVRGQRLNCSLQTEVVEEIVCRNHRRFVLLYRFKLP